MNRITIITEPFVGFAAEGAKPGESVRIIQRGFFKADDPRFYMFINQIDEAFLAPSGLSGDGITKFFIVVHSDNMADFYTDYNVIVEVRTNRDIRAGEHIYVHDITDVEGYRLEEISIRPDDAVICVMKVGWKYGLYFDVTRSTSEEEVWRQLGLLYGSLHVDRIVQNIQKQIRESEQPHVITEGKTDWRHIEAARRNLKVDILLGYPTTDESLGDAALLQVCERLAKFGPPNRNRVIAIFDRDNPKVMRRLEELGPLDGYQPWGNNVYSFVLPRPRHRDGYKNISVEMLYTDQDVATTTPDGKRLFFDNELKKEVIPGSPARFVPIPSVEDRDLEKKVFDELADRIIDDSGRQVGLSKARFAELVYGRVDSFGELDFSAFTDVFQIIKDIIVMKPEDLTPDEPGESTGAPRD